MKTNLLEVLGCPKCKNSLTLESSKTENSGNILEGNLQCADCQKTYPITGGIPRFVELDNYGSSFGYQWNLFRKEQIDSFNSTGLSAERFWAETSWAKESLKGKWILDAGCGAGRFLDVASTSEAEVVGIDISNAIDAAKENLQGRENVHFVQASIYELPFKEGIFDACYCIGVIQHTPDPAKTMACLPKILKEKGQLAVTIYEKRKWFTRLHSKYLLRPITQRLPQPFLLKLIKGGMPIFFPLTNVLFRLPVLGKFFMFAIPIANYVNEPRLSSEQRKAWAILDTFDMLAPAYDQPQTESEARTALLETGLSDIRRLPNPGLNLIGEKHPAN
jgi:SAM-dependent methyltransferase/uncharacterized protein YbaR (Trm112 family)